MRGDIDKSPTYELTKSDFLRNGVLLKERDGKPLVVGFDERVSGDARFVAHAKEDGEGNWRIRIFDCQTGLIRQELAQHPTLPLSTRFKPSVSFSSGSRFLLIKPDTFSRLQKIDKNIFVYELNPHNETYELLAQFYVDEYLDPLIISKDGKYIISCSTIPWEFCPKAYVCNKPQCEQCEEIKSRFRERFGYERGEAQGSVITVYQREQNETGVTYRQVAQKSIATPGLRSISHLGLYANDSIIKLSFSEPKDNVVSNPIELRYFKYTIDLEPCDDESKTLHGHHDCPKTSSFFDTRKVDPSLIPSKYEGRYDQARGTIDERVGFWSDWRLVEYFDTARFKLTSSSRYLHVSHATYSTPDKLTLVARTRVAPDTWDQHHVYVMSIQLPPVQPRP